MSEEKVELTESIFGTATLGSLIDELEKCRPSAEVQFDFCYLRPTKVASYRGYYDHLAIGWTEKSYGPEHHWIPVPMLLVELKDAVGKSFEGYKGGDYTMTRDTPVWVANGARVVGMVSLVLM